MQFLLGMLFTILHDIIVFSIFYDLQEGKMYVLSLATPRYLMFYTSPHPLEFPMTLLLGVDKWLFPGPACNMTGTLYADLKARLYSDFSKEGLIHIKRLVHACVV